MIRNEMIFATVFGCHKSVALTSCLPSIAEIKSRGLIIRHKETDVVRGPLGRNSVCNVPYITRFDRNVDETFFKHCECELVFFLAISYL